MLKKNRDTLIVASIVCLLPALVGVGLWNKLPDTMATHFGINNEADGFMSKPFAVFGLPFFCFCLLWICAFTTSRDPRKQNISPKMFAMTLWIAPAVSMFCAAISYPYNLGKSVNIGSLSMIFLGMVFVIIGNYIPKLRQNYTIGIRIPWTLASEENWNRTHRMAGPIWMIGGAVMILLALIGSMNIALMFAVLTALVIIPSVYSYLLAAKSK